MARRLCWEFEDADWLHPAANVDKMHNGIPLTDEDRKWLVKRCQVWAGKLDDARVQLENNKEIGPVRVEQRCGSARRVRFRRATRPAWGTPCTSNAPILCH